MQGEEKRKKDKGKLASIWNRMAAVFHEGKSQHSTETIGALEKKGEEEEQNVPGGNKTKGSASEGKGKYGRGEGLLRKRK